PQHLINPEIKSEDVFQQRQQAQRSWKKSTKLSPVFAADTKQHSQAAQDEPQSSVALHRGKRGRDLDENCLMPMPSRQHDEPNCANGSSGKGNPLQYPACSCPWQSSTWMGQAHP